MIGPYELNQIYCGDCVDLMAQLPDNSIDLVFTSPPYNLQVTTGGGFPTGESTGKWGREKIRHGKGSKWQTCALADGYSNHDDAMPPDEYKAWQKKILLDLWRVIKPTGAIYYNHKPRVQGGILQTPLDLNPGLPIRQIVIWQRAGGINFSDTHYLPTHEWIVIFAKSDFRLKSKGASGIGDIWEAPQDTNNPHPAPFPPGLPLRALETVKPGIVLDPFMGSGTVGVAAKEMGWQFLGFELSQEYIDYARRRIGNAKVPLFVPAENGKVEPVQLGF